MPLNIWTKSNKGVWNDPYDLQCDCMMDKIEDQGNDYNNEICESDCECEEDCGCHCECNVEPDECCENVKLIGSDEFIFDCHPFKQGNERDMEYYGHSEKDFDKTKIELSFYDKKEPEIKGPTFNNLDVFDVIKNNKPELGYSFKWNEIDVFVSSFSSDIMVYILSRNGTIISVLLDPEMIFQYGDAGTCVYKSHDGKTLLIHNYGDVSSLIEIKKVNNL